MTFADIPDEIIKLAEKYTKNVSKRRNIFKAFRREIIRKKIMQKFAKFIKIVPYSVFSESCKQNNEFEYVFENSYRNEAEKIEVITRAKLKFKCEINEFELRLTLIEIKFEKSVTEIS